MNRTEILLKKAATTLIDGADPFCTEWLAENSVTLDEVYCLSSTIGQIINHYLCMTREDKTLIIATGMLADNEILLNTFKSFFNNNKVSRQIKNL